MLVSSNSLGVVIQLPPVHAAQDDAFPPRQGRRRRIRPSRLGQLGTNALDQALQVFNHLFGQPGNINGGVHADTLEAEADSSRPRYYLGGRVVKGTSACQAAGTPGSREGDSNGHFFTGVPLVFTMYLLGVLAGT